MKIPEEISNLLERFSKIENNKDDFHDTDKGYGYEEEVDNIENEIDMLEGLFDYEEEALLESLKLRIKKLKSELDFFDEEAECKAIFPDGNDEDDDFF
jgi:hypothetical protein